MSNNNRRLGIYAALIVFLSANVMLCFILVRIRTGAGTEDNEGGNVPYQSHYAFICADSEDDFYEAVYESARREGEKRGDYIEFMGEELSVSYTTSDLMDIAVESGMDGIIVEAPSSSRLTRLIDKAADAGIPVVTLGNDHTESRRNAYVGIAYYSVGQTFGEQLSRLRGDSVKSVTVLMTSGGGDTSQDIIYSGIKNYIENTGLSGYFSINAEFIDDSQPYVAEETVSSLLGRDEIPDVLICLDENETSSACQAIVDLNRVGETTILGFYMNDTILSAISNGILSSTIVMDAEKMGEYCVETLDSYRENGVVNEYTPVETYVIDKTNVDSFVTDMEPDQ